MKTQYCTDEMVSELMAMLLGAHPTPREKHALREALRSLVRLAKSEQLLEMKTNVRKLTGTIAGPLNRSRTKSQQHTSQYYTGWQQQFEFMKFDR